MRGARPWIALALGLAGCSTPDAIPDCSPGAQCPKPAAQDVVDPLVAIGRASGPTFIEIVDVVADGDTVYACTGTKGLTIYDAASEDSPPATVRDRLGPTSLGLANENFPRCQHVALDRTTGRVAITNRGDEIQPTPWVWVYDVSDRNAIDAVAGWTPSGSVEGVVLEGERLYAAMHTGGLAVVQIGDAGAPALLGSYADDESDAWQPVRSGEHLLVAEGATGLRIYDTSADEPTLVSTLPLPGSSRDVVARDGLAYVATSGGISIVDVSDPSSPRVVGETEVDGTTLGLALSTDDTLVTAEWDEIRGYDVSDPASPRAIFAERVPSDDIRSRILAIDADPARGRVYAGEWRGLHAYRQANGTGPELFITPSTLQFGTLDRGESSERVIVLRNRGDQPLTVADIVGGPGVTADAACMQIDPGGAAAVEVTLKAHTDDLVATGLRVCSDDIDEPEHTISATANVPGVDVGDRVPMFQLTDQNGEVWSPERLQGKVAVLAYFATF